MKLISITFLISTAVVLGIQAQDTAIPELNNSIFEPIVASENCPDVQYKCPNCPFGSVCVYPDSGGCENAGIPVCQSLDCSGILCLTRRLPCPKECPFTCRYNGPSCCPFIGEPVCEPDCRTFVRCAFTPCPDDCPNDCYYPDADYCCPKSGPAVCKKKKLSLPSSSEGIAAISMEVKEDGSFYGEHKDVGVGENHRIREKRDVSAKTIIRRQDSLVCAQYIIPCPEECPDSCIYPMDAPCPFTLQPWCPNTSTDLDGAQTSEDLIVCALFIVPCPEECPDSCVYPMDAPCPFTLPPSCPDSLKKQPPVDMLPPKDPIICPLFIVPCPEECPESCIYPTEANCPFTHQPWCPTPSKVPSGHLKPTEEPTVCPLFIVPCPEACPDSCIYPMKARCPYTHQPSCPVPALEPGQGVTPPSPSPPHEKPTVCALYIVPCPEECPNNCVYPMNAPCPFTHQPWCPEDEPDEEEEDENEDCGQDFHANHPHHGKPTPSFVTPEPTTVPDDACPAILVLCPPECPDTCLRYNVPCPFATKGYCPGTTPTVTTDYSSITTTVSSTSGCPGYMFACPYCSEGYSCTQATTGDCPNTNVPYCVPTAAFA